MRISDWSSDVCSSDLAYRAVVVGLPTDAAEDRCWPERRHAPPTITLHVIRRFTEAQIEVEAMRDVSERDPGQYLMIDERCEWRRRDRYRLRRRIHGVCSGNSRSSSARSKSATVTPCVKAETLMQARSAGVMSSVRRAV